MITETISIIIGTFKGFITMVQVMPSEFFMGFGMFIGLLLTPTMIKGLNKLNDVNYTEGVKNGK